MDGVRDFVANVTEGSWADWFAAVGTVGALWIAAFTYVRDRRRHRRSDADHLRAWTILARSAGAWEVRLVLENTGPHPILDVFIRSHPRAHRVAEGVIDADDEFGLRAGQRVEKRFPYGTAAPQRTIRRLFRRPERRLDDRLYLFFTDARGQSWVRNVSRNTTVPRSRRTRLTRAMDRRDAATREHEQRRLRSTAEAALGGPVQFL